MGQPGDGAHLSAPAPRLLLGDRTWSSVTGGGFQWPLPEGRVVPGLVFILSQTLVVQPSSEFCEFLTIVLTSTLRASRVASGNRV